jgi:ketosteroid isomerase-like protein
LIEHGDSVVVMAHSLAEGRTSGVATDVRVSHVWTVRAGKVARFQTFASHAEALEAVGLSE